MFKAIIKILFLIVGSILLLFAAYAHLIESSASHTGDFFGDVFMFFFGIPGIILLSLGISFFKSRKIFFYVYGSVFIYVFIQSQRGLPDVPEYIRASIFGMSLPWMICGIIYLLLALFQKNNFINQSDHKQEAREVKETHRG